MAAFTLFDLVYRTLREVGAILETSATAGATTSITDGTYLLGRFIDDYFNGGTAFVLYDAGGAAAAPQGEWSKITDFVKTTGVVTISPALTQAVAAGDRVALATAEFQRDEVISQINNELGQILIEKHDDSTITTDAEKTEYTLPAAMLDQDIEVYINTNDTTDDNYWVRTDEWYLEEEDTGTAKKLIFNNQPIEPYHVRIKYWTYHPPLYASSDKLRESVDINRVVLPAAYNLLEWKMMQKSEVDPNLEKKMALLFPRVEKVKATKTPRKGYIKYATLGVIDNLGISGY